MIDRERRTLKISKSLAAAVAVMAFTAGLFLEIRRDTTTRSLSAPAVTTAAAKSQEPYVDRHVVPCAEQHGE